MKSSDDLVFQMFRKSLIYGYEVKTLRAQSIQDATLFLDPLFQNFIWVTSRTKAYVLDLAYASISSYCPELQLQLQPLLQTPQKLSKYLILKDYDIQIKIIFDKQSGNIHSKHQGSQRLKQKRPTIQPQIQRLIEQAKLSGKQYSNNFSKLMKYFCSQFAKQANYPSFPISLETMEKICKNIGASQIINIKEYMSKHSNNKNTLDTVQILKVLKIYYCKSYQPLFKKFYQNIKVQNDEDFITKKMGKTKSISSELTFFQLLNSLQNVETNYACVHPKIDESLPLTNYFCFSSHNTYLSGNQLTSDSKIERYIEDLKKGIKCVQIDVHNNGDNQPVITHAFKGQGFCKQINFRKTIQVIDEYLQTNPDHFPIIFSIQNHSKNANRDLMNNILHKQFNKLIMIPKNDHKKFYSLSQLKSKIIIKSSSCLEDISQFKSKINKKLNSFDDFQIDQIKTFNKNPSIPQAGQNKYEQRFPKQFREKLERIKKLKSQFDKGVQENSNFFLPIQKIAQITGMFKSPKGIQTPQGREHSPYQCTSLVNSKIQDLNYNKISEYSKKSWLRSYPVGSQIASSNYKPFQMLLKGTQIIALNTQTKDDFAFCMQSYFRSHGKNDMKNLGYIQKPDHLLQKPKTNNIEYPKLTNYTMIFYSNYEIEVQIYGIQQIKVDKLKGHLQTSIMFELKYYNQSFLKVTINKKWIQCIPLRFLVNGYRVIMGKKQNFEDSGLRIITFVNFQTAKPK